MPELVSSAGKPRPEEELQDKVEEESDKESPFPFDGGIVVFGHGWSKPFEVGGGWRLSQEAYMRTVGAYQLWSQGLAPRIILTGGPPSEIDKEKYGGDLLPNSEQMAKLLVERFKVPPDVIITESKSTNTIENVAHSLNGLQEQGIPVNEFVTVSNGFHMDRITEIMRKFSLKSLPISAEQALNDRALAHATKMKEREEAKSLNPAKIEHNFQVRRNRYAQVIDRIHRDNEALQKEIQTENKWLGAMKEMPGFWIPQVLALKGERLKEIVTTHKDDIQNWLSRHPDIGLTIEDLMMGNFDYRELSAKGREVPN